MTKELYELLSSDIFTDDSEYAERVKRIRDIIANTTFADQALEREARGMYANDDLEIDPEPPTSGSEEGTWVQAWVWVAKEETEPFCMCFDNHVCIDCKADGK